MIKLLLVLSLFSDTLITATEILPEGMSSKHLLIDSDSNSVAVFNSTNWTGAYLDFKTQNTSIGRLGAAYQTLYNSNANDIALSSATGKVILGTDIYQRLVVTNSGDVGIGTIAPTKKLDVQGNSIFNGTMTITGRSDHYHIQTENIDVYSALQVHGEVFFMSSGTGYPKINPYSFQLEGVDKIPQSDVLNMQNMIQTDTLIVGDVSIWNALQLPRKTTSQILAIPSPAPAQVVYDSTQNRVVYYNGTAWRKIVDEAL